MARRPRGPSPRHPSHGFTRQPGLCRRHHRIKQLIGWRVSLRPDATVLWVDPLDQRRLTRPLDHRGRQQPPPATPRPSDPVEARDGADTLTEDERAQRIKEALAREPEFSVLEHHYEHALLRTEPGTRRARATLRRLNQTGNLPDHRHFPDGLVQPSLAAAGNTGWRVELEHDGPTRSRHLNHPRWGEDAKYDEPPF